VSATGKFSSHREERRPVLSVNETVRGKVLSSSGKRVLIEFDQQKLWAESLVPLKAGRKLFFQVMSTHPKIELQVVEDPLPQQISRLLHLFGGRWQLFSFLEKIADKKNSLFDKLSSSSKSILQECRRGQNQLQPLIDGKFGAHVSRYLGLDLEAKLAEGDTINIGSLKSALLEIVDKSDSGDVYARDAGRLLQSLELFQLCQVRLAQQDIYLLPLPLPFFDQGYLLAEGGRQDDANKETPFQISLNLSLQGLGNIKIRMLLDKKELSLCFSGDNTVAIDSLSEFQTELRRSLSAFPLRHLSFSVGCEDPVKSLLKKVVMDGIIDARV
jgi:hypothetical protein